MAMGSMATLAFQKYKDPMMDTMKKVFSNEKSTNKKKSENNS